MFGKVTTRSNYRGLNEQWVEIEEFRGNLVSLKIYDEVTGEPKSVDVQLREISEIRPDKPKDSLI